jgi:hypothetical protein
MSGSTGAGDPPTGMEIPAGQAVQVSDHGTLDDTYVKTDIKAQRIRPIPVPVAGQVATRPRPPGRLRQVWNTPARNPRFTDRDQLLDAARELMSLVDEAGTRAGKYTVHLRDAQGVQFVDYNTQDNTSNPPRGG